MGHLQCSFFASFKIFREMLFILVTLLLLRLEIPFGCNVILEMDVYRQQLYEDEKVYKFLFNWIEK